MNIVAEAVTQHSPLTFVSLCEGPIYYPAEIARLGRARPRAARTDDGRPEPRLLERRATYDGADAMPLIAGRLGAPRGRPDADRRRTVAQLRIAAAMGSVPSEYFQYYYCVDEVLAELEAKPTTRAEDIMGWSPDYWRHYAEQATTRRPDARPGALARRHPRARAGDRRDGRRLQRQGRGAPVNVPNAGGALPGLRGGARRRGAGPRATAGIEALPASAPLPRHVARADRDARRVPGAGRRGGLVGHPQRRACARSLRTRSCCRCDKAERIYDELAAAHREYLPERLLA